MRKTEKWKRESYIIGIIDHVDHVKSKRYSIYDQISAHNDLFPFCSYKLWRWGVIGIKQSVYSSKLNDEDIYRIKTHLKKKYKIECEDYEN